MLAKVNDRVSPVLFYSCIDMTQNCNGITTWCHGSFFIVLSGVRFLLFLGPSILFVTFEIVAMEFKS